MLALVLNYAADYSFPSWFLPKLKSLQFGRAVSRSAVVVGILCALALEEQLVDARKKEKTAAEAAAAQKLHTNSVAKARQARRRERRAVGRTQPPKAESTIKQEDTGSGLAETPPGEALPDEDSSAEAPRDKSHPAGAPTTETSTGGADLSEDISEA